MADVDRGRRDRVARSSAAGRFREIELAWKEADPRTAAVLAEVLRGDRFRDAEGASLFPTSSSGSSRIVRDRCGIEFTTSNRFLLESRIAAPRRRVAARRRAVVPSPAAIRQHGGIEVDALIDRVTNPETYFFREPEQLAAFTDEVVPEWERESPARAAQGLERGVRLRRRALHARHAAGRERVFERHDVDIFGSDVSPGASGSPGRRLPRELVPADFRGAPLEVLRAEGPGRYRIREDVRRRVSFGRVNLIESARLSTLPVFHVIFCRNVLIYLSDSAKRSVVASLHRRLAPGGYLFLGRVESLVAFSTEFHLRHLKHDMVYQK